MYRIRLHGRGGQGIKTAGRILGTSLFLEGFEVQDAPRYGAERRGAPISAMIRADHVPINERGIVTRPDLVVVVDDTLIGVPGAEVGVGLHPDCVVLIMSDRPSDEWEARIRAPGLVITHEPGERHVTTARAIGAAARLVGVISRDVLEAAIDMETGALSPAARSETRAVAVSAFDGSEARAGLARESARQPATPGAPDWIDLSAESADLAAPAIHAASNMVEVKTGLWRSLRPVVHDERCHRCVWICGTACPDGAITRDPSGYPVVDLDHCKGCMICVAECPSHAIEAVAETAFATAESGRRTNPEEARP